MLEGCLWGTKVQSKTNNFMGRRSGGTNQTGGRHEATGKVGGSVTEIVCTLLVFHVHVPDRVSPARWFCVCRVDYFPGALAEGKVTKDKRCTFITRLKG
ncbi:hypothetical protein RRG08_043518 [Elysia crispata]|uniref:Uncharacterized protein n=1 Tax=Elysia crispata TaxID=231223 RepID=A0AAE0YGE3_9GAST|nr:hypothetical protein RRG08_043518 [Elysia crispata]